MIKEIVDTYPHVTDIHMTEGEKVVIRVNGILQRIDQETSPDFFGELLDKYKEKEKYEINHILDVSGAVGKKRLRLHFYEEAGKRALAIRVLPDISELPYDPDSVWLEELGRLPSGLVLISGTAGSGKSTTLARIISSINQNRACHIITMEDPVEYIFPQSKALIHQKTVGKDVESFAEAVRDAMREDPDVLMIGEMRDAATMKAALMAAETGHLVFATVHNRKVSEAVGRIVHSFPAGEESEMRQVLASVLRVIIAQTLWRHDEKTVLLREILTNSPAVANLIRTGKEEQLSSYMETGNKYMRTFKQAVYRIQNATTEEQNDMLHHIGQ